MIDQFEEYSGIDLPSLSQSDLMAKRWYSESYSGHWYEQRIPDKLLRSRYIHGNYVLNEAGLYEEFCIWATKNCIGHWALPRSHSLLFTHEEDKVMFVLKFL